ncbi:hypothetical protein [Streptomyces sp. NPDC005408]|uniref:hypothetical protein n=1 Tax=Streptomyces sp. NPDC005408 TaxID=3155341 RepID=UPI0033BDAF01
MRDGGSNSDSVDGAVVDGPTEPSGRFRRLRKHRLLASGVAVVVLAAGVAIPLAVADSGDDTPCWQLPASARALADDPAAATRALDPGDDLARLGSAKKLLAHEEVCGDGARVLGRIVDGATRSAGPGKPHTMAQARTAYAVAAALDDVELPAGLAPGVARMVAEYVVDAARHDSLHDDDVSGPALPPEEARLDEQGWVWLGRFLAPREARAAFEYADRGADADADIEDLVGELAKDPEAFAILYDAERAYLAHYLERLTGRGGDPAFRPRPAGRDSRYSSTATTWPDNDLEDLAERVGNLMKFRAGYTRDGTIPDLAAFDTSVREHTRGTFRPAPGQLDTRPPMGDIAGRPVAGPVRGDLMDGRHQMFTVLDQWAQERKVPAQRARAMRQLVDDAYVRALWLRF